MSAIKSKTHKVEMSGVVYVKDPRDVTMIETLKQQVADLKKENKRLASEYTDKKKVIDKIWREAVAYVRNEVLYDLMDEYDTAKVASSVAYEIGESVGRKINLKVKSELARVNKQSVPEHFYDEW